MYCIITGASRGIGRELALLLAKEKYDLFLTCKNNIELLHNLKIELENKYNITVKIKKGHILSEDFIDVDAIRFVINNASETYYSLLQDVNIEKYNEIIDSNLTDAFLTTKYSIPVLLGQKDGVIINISSAFGICGGSMEVIYSMTKGGIITFTKALSKELLLSNIKVICFALGYVETDMNNNLSDDEKNDIINQLNDKNMTDKIEVAKYIIDVLKNNKYKTGDIIDMTNGLMNII